MLCDMDKQMKSPDHYSPISEELARFRDRSDKLRVSGDGVFATLQGEGASAGAPAVFLRLQDCNLHCGQNGEGWQCDAWYTWDRSKPQFWQEQRLASPESLVGEIQSAWDDFEPGCELAQRLVLTGGEPLLQQANIVPLIKQLPNWNIEIETNGTIVPLSELRDCQINCSPKLASSGNNLRARYRPDALRAIASLPNHWFKFVVASRQDLAEIEQIVSENDISYSRVLLMSEGVEAESLQASDERLAGIAKSLGCLVTARNHIFWYGDKRRT
jgi:7-carboxy-7-deazaguanine synthase